MIKSTVEGEKEVLARISTVSTKTIRRIDETVGAFTLRLSRSAQVKLSGGVVNKRSGSVLTAIQRGTSIKKYSWGIRGTVGASGASKKVAIAAGAIEYGSTHQARILEATKAGTLRFQIGGKTVFAKRVLIPAFEIPERSFLRSSLRELGPSYLSAMNSAVQI